MFGSLLMERASFMYHISSADLKYRHNSVVYQRLSIEGSADSPALAEMSFAQAKSWSRMEPLLTGILFQSANDDEASCSSDKLTCCNAR